MKAGRRTAAMAVAVAAVVAAGGVALAAIPDSETEAFHGCYSAKTWALRLIDPSKGQRCATGEKPVTWDQAGIRWRGTRTVSVSYSVHDAVGLQLRVQCAARNRLRRCPPVDH